MHRPRSIETSAPVMAASEWKAMWPLPVVGLLGYFVCCMFTYSSGVFMGIMTAEFGWTRAEFSSALSMQMLVGLVTGPLIGRLIDRYGPRPVALGGIATFVVGLSLLGLADGSITQWRVMCALEGIAISAISAPTWATAVASRFNASRGLALGVVLCATGVAMAFWPMAAVAVIATVGWRLAFPVIALTSAAVLFPLTLYFFYGAADLTGARDREDEPQALPRLAPMLFSRTFILLLLAACLYASAALGLTLHLVPILMENGLGLADAAAVAGLAGIGGVLGRLLAGYLLDNFPTRRIATAAFALPVLYIACLWSGDGSIIWSMAGALLLGFTAGAESDVVAYIASHRFDRTAFASLFAIFMAFMGIAASIGPLVASILYDRNGSYDAFFVVCVPLTLTSAVLIFFASDPKSAH